LTKGKKERSTAARRKRQRIHFDEREDVIASLDLLGLLVSKVDKNPRYWKWVIIAAQSALQGSLVCTLSGTAGIGALRKDLQAKWLDWFDHRSGPTPCTRLESFKTLLEWACNPKRMVNSEAAPLKLSASQTRDLHKLHDHLRNQFTHFTPMGWTIVTADLPRIVLTSVEIAENVMLNHFHVRMHLSGNQIRRIERAATAVRVAFG
jgi:hypothetical protein